MAKNVNLLDYAPQPAINLLARAMAHFEDISGLDRPRCQSSSRYQEGQTFEIQAANGVNIAAFRCIVGDYYTDPRFSENWENSNGVIPFQTGYGVIKPSLVVSEQCDRWFTAQPEIRIIPRIIDLELSDGQSAYTIAMKTWEMSERIADRDGKRPLIYSRRLLVRDWLIPYWTEEQINAHWYYLAQYLWDRTREHPGPPDVVPGLPLERVVIQQTADKKPALPGETETGTITWDRWCLGDIAQMMQFIAEKWGGGEPEPTVEDRLNKLEVVSRAEHPQYWD